MELRQLEYFESACRLKSFTKAATEHCVSQPSITVAIRKLEEELGISLFQRSQQKITITHEGDLFLKSVKKVLSHLEDAIQEMNDLRPDSNNLLNLGIPPILGSWMYSLILSDYSKKHPNVKLSIRELGTHNIIQHLIKEEIELGFVVFEDPISMFEMLPVSQGELFLLIPQDHPLSSYERVPFDRLRDEEFIMFPKSTFIYQKVMEECQRHHFSPAILCSPSQIVTAFNLVASGSGIAFILDDSFPMIKDNSNFAIRPFADPIQFHSGLIWKSGKYLSNGSRKFIDFIKSRK
jgi:DNA-binding transcriptional LysR family regulator